MYVAVCILVPYLSNIALCVAIAIIMAVAYHVRNVLTNNVSCLVCTTNLS